MRTLIVVVVAGIAPALSSYMDCGSGVSLCGVLTLESGLGSGPYEHDEPCAHGLWPQTTPYGNSACVEPDSTSDPSRDYTCYDASSDDDGEVVPFEIHEWEKHGEVRIRSVSEQYRGRSAPASRTRRTTFRRFAPWPRDRSQS